MSEQVIVMKKGTRNINQVLIYNDTNHAIMVPPETSLGSLQLVRLITPLCPPVAKETNRQVGDQPNQACNMNVERTEEESGYEGFCKNRSNKADSERLLSILKNIDMTMLTSREKEAATTSLISESIDMFCESSDEIGDVPDCKMKIKLKDSVPVQRFYRTMPRPLHLEVKNYVEDLLNKEWITKSTSCYSSLIVAVERKMAL